MVGTEKGGGQKEAQMSSTKGIKSLLFRKPEQTASVLLPHMASTAGAAWSSMSLQEPPGGRLLPGSAQDPPPSLLPASGEGCPQPRAAGGSSGRCSSKAILQPKLLCPPASKSFPSRGREIIYPSPSVGCGFGHLGQGLHQLVARRLALLCGGTW